MNINYNGALIGAEGNILALHNRAFAYGDAVTDVSKYSYQQLLFWEEHYLRLMAGMRVLRMNIPMSFSMEYIEEEILKTIRSNALESQPVRVRISIFRKSGNTYTPTNNDIEYLIETQPLSSAFYVLNEEPYEVELFKDFYIQPDLLANIKHTNRIVNVLGSIFAQENDYQNCILLNSQKNIAGALDGNIFLVNGNTLKTPALTDGAVNGITRKMLIKSLQKVGDYQVEETSISPFELQKADELFITNSLIGIQPVSQYRKKTYTHTATKSLIGKLNTIARFGIV
ncbi:aminotransferase class IV [Capnocytophaga leadbetteri]|jgi:aminotransferase class IV|uniref:aminotransferase class IV n=1 Tax=Capnocytophaga leadbetteri TaxID=327575 RepID=UPI0026EDD193|nr:aminotransferase class IV [Capnocytophaga leadbetteri]